MAFTMAMIARLMTSLREETSQLLPPISGYEREPLVSLKEACKPLKKILGKELKTNIIIATNNASKPRDGLTQDEAASLHLYTIEWTVRENSLYYVLNDLLHSADRQELIPWHKYLKLILTAFYKLPATSHQTVWRGISGDLRKQYPKEKQFTWWSFTSCTSSIGSLESATYMPKSGPRTIFSIETHRGKSIRKHSYFAKEDEVLLPPGILLQVIDRMKLSKDACIIHLREITPPYKMIEDPFDLRQNPPMSNVPARLRRGSSPASTISSVMQFGTSNQKTGQRISALNQHDLIRPVSRLNDKYQCTIVKVEFLPGSIKVHIDSRGDNSRGTLQPPLMSSLGVHEGDRIQNFISPAHGQFSVNNLNAQYLGSLTFLVDKSYFKGRGIIGFRYGMDGYSISQLFRFDEKELDRWNL